MQKNQVARPIWEESPESVQNSLQCFDKQEYVWPTVSMLQAKQKINYRVTTLVSMHRRWFTKLHLTKMTDLIQLPKIQYLS